MAVKLVKVHMHTSVLKECNILVSATEVHDHEGL